MLEKSRKGWWACWSSLGWDGEDCWNNERNHDYNNNYLFIGINMLNYMIKFDDDLSTLICVFKLQKRKKSIIILADNRYLFSFSFFYHTQ